MPCPDKQKDHYQEKIEASWRELPEGKEEVENTEIQGLRITCQIQLVAELDLEARGPFLSLWSYHSFTTAKIKPAGGKRARVFREEKALSYFQVISIPG